MAKLRYNVMRKKLILMLLITSASVVVAQTTGTQKPQAEQGGVPRLEHADVPLYPQMARVARIFGTIEVQVTVKDGEVVNTEVKSPRPGAAAILERAAVENIRTWRFYKLDSGTFMTKFIYQIETKKKSLSSLNSKVELELPLLVKITTRPPVLDTQHSSSAVTGNQ
jgi:Gram-negative bacterial TonB protein C-terminal